MAVHAILALFPSGLMCLLLLQGACLGRALRRPRSSRRGNSPSAALRTPMRSPRRRRPLAEVFLHSAPPLHQPSALEPPRPLLALDLRQRLHLAQRPAQRLPSAPPRRRRQPSAQPRGLLLVSGPCRHSARSLLLPLEQPLPPPLEGHLGQPWAQALLLEVCTRPPQTHWHPFCIMQSCTSGRHHLRPPSIDADTADFSVDQ